MELDYRAFIIGNSNYSDTEEFPTIEFAVRDAGRIFKLLTDSDTALFSREKSICIENVDLDELVNELDYFANEIERNSSLVLIYFAGHAKVKEGELYLSTTNADTNNLETTAYWIGRLIPLLKKIGGRYIVVLDCCRAGVALKSPVMRHRGNAEIESKLFERLSGKGKIVIASTREYQLAHEIENLKHGLFSFYFAEGIEEGLNKRAAEVPFIGIQELFEYVANNIKENFPDIAQEPIWSGEDVEGELYVAKNRLIKTPTLDHLSKLLMIDDDADHIRQVQEYLDEDVYLVDAASDPIQSVRMARENPPDLIILDIQMVPLDGFGVLERLQNSKNTRDIPIVIYSIVGEEDETILRGLGLGVDQTVHKGRRGALRLLEARIRHLLTDTELHNAKIPVRKFRVDGHELLIYGDGARVVRDSQDIALSRYQRSVLVLLADAEGGSIHTDELSRFLYEDLLGEKDWSYARDNGRFYRYMNGLRKKVEPDPHRPTFIQSQRDVGYYLRGFVQ